MVSTSRTILKPGVLVGTMNAVLQAHDSKARRASGSGKPAIDYQGVFFRTRMVMTTSLRAALEHLLDGWSADVPAAWRHILSGAQLDFAAVDAALTLTKLGGTAVNW
jgi:hypothetical protein